MWKRIHIEGRDIIALVVVTGGLILIGMGINGTIGALMIMVIAFYFGEKAMQGKK